MLENKILTAILIVIAFWLASYLAVFIVSFLKKLTSQTKTNLDDKMVEAAKLPIKYLVILFGFYYAVYYTGFNLSWRGINVEVFFLALIILLLSFAASRMLKTFFDWYAQKEDEARKINKTMFIFIRKITSATIYILAILLILSNFGVQIGPLIAGLGIAGLAIAFGLQETIANLFSALFLVMDKSINIDDWIQLEDGTKAYIEDISWRSVRIRTIGGNAVIVPNSKFVGQNISSYDYPVSSFYTSIQVGVSYDTDLDKAEYVAIQAGEKVIKNEGIKEMDNNPIVRFKELADSSINFVIIIKVDKVQDEGRVKHALIKEIVKQFRENNIEIPFPQTVVEIKK